MKKVTVHTIDPYLKRMKWVSIVLDIKEGSQLHKCLMSMMTYRKEFDKITD